MNIKNIIQQSIELKQKLYADEQLVKRIEDAALSCITAYKAGGKLLLCGNGGSAADAQHIAAELSGRFNYDRPPLYAEALHVNSSFTTAVANDYSYDVVYSRMVQAMGKSGDVLIAISTSGNSLNVWNAVEKANELGMITIGLTGESGGKLAESCTTLINIPSSDTARIQEVHILIGHIICEMIETAMFPLTNDK